MIHSQWFNDLRELIGTDIKVSCGEGVVYEGKLLKAGYQFMFMLVNNELRLVNLINVKAIKPLEE